MTVHLGVVCEGPADRDTGCQLADRVICEHVDWITEEVIDDYRQWRGLDGPEPLLWRRVHDEARRRSIRARGHFDGRPGALDARSARLALLLFRAVDPPPEAIVLLRDDDRQTQRREGLEQARREIESEWPVAVVIGVAHVMRECWVICGFLPQDDAEQKRLQQVRVSQELGYDPTTHPHRLTAANPTAKNSSKRVLRYLVQEDPGRERDCWQTAPLGHLAERGRDVGLRQYLREICRRLVPLFTGRPVDCGDYS
jgi:hypothetical protein